MTRHRFDPIAFVLGAIAVAAGIAVAVGAFDAGDVDYGWWLGAVALAIGIALIPWGRRSNTAHDS